MNKLLLILCICALNACASAADGEWSPYVFSSLVYDSNIERDLNPTVSFGHVIGGGIHYRNDKRKPSFELNYELGVHEYSNSSRFDRTSHEASAIYHQKFTNKFRADWLAEISIKGSSEERDVTDTYSLQPRFEYRFTDKDRLKLQLNYRIRKPLNDPGGNAHNRYAKLVFEKRLPKSQIVQLSTRYEINRAENDANDFNRWSHEISYQVGSGPAVFSIAARYRLRDYLSRLVGSDLRQDRYQEFDARLEQALTPQIGIDVVFRYIHRDSNDPTKIFTQHVAFVTLLYKF